MKVLNSMSNLVSLYNGDYKNFEKEIPDESIDLIITDPPYGINYLSNKQTSSTRTGKTEPTNNKKYFERIQGDANSTDYDLNQITLFNFLYQKLKPNSAIYVFCHWKKWSVAEKAAEQSGFNIKNMIVINKSNHGMGDLQGQYAPKHELILYAVKGRHILDNSVLGRGKDVIEGKILYSGAKRFHPNEKPISWIEPLILRSSNTSNVILDPFMGSGSTGVACVKNNRQFIGIEINSTYYDIAKQRLIKN